MKTESRKAAKAGTKKGSKTVRITTIPNIDILALALTVKEYLELLIDHNAKLFLEQANGCLSSYYFVRELIGKAVFKGYRGAVDIKKLKSFYFPTGKELSNDWDRLHWEETKDVGKKAEWSTNQ
jgi:hypothetical protein